MTAPSSMPCSIADCGKYAFKGGLCHAHIKRRQRNKSLSAPVRERAPNVWLGLLKAVQDFADAADEVSEGDAAKAWQRALYRLRDALKRYNKKKRGAKIPYGELRQQAARRR